MVWGIVAGLGGGLQEGLESKERRAASKSQRTIAEAEEKRNVDRHQWLKGLGDIFQNRDVVDNLEKYRQWYTGGIYQPQPAQPKPVGGDAINQTVQQALPALQTINNMGTTAPQIPGMAEGGLAQVPQQPQQPPQQMMGPQALPVQQPQQSAPQQELPKRRERYNQWYNQAAKYAILNGGLEGYQKFEEMENAASRRQVLGYALQAVNAMDQGNIGEAMRAGNAALEVTPFDTGLKFTAENGKLYMVGQDGKKGKPLDADMLRAFTDDHMKTPENYLDWKKQYETERSNQVQEGISAKNAESTRRQVDQYVEEGPSRINARDATAYANLAQGAKYLADAAGAGDTHKSWSANNVRQMEKDISAAAKDAMLGFNGPWDKEMMADTPLGSLPIQYTKDIRRINEFDKMSDDLAAAIARGALMNYVPDAPGEQAIRGGVVSQDEDTGEFVFTLHGEDYVLPDQIALGLNLNLKDNEQRLSNPPRRK